MMIVQIDKMSAPSSSFDRAQRLYERNIELENKLRKSAQARLPSDPNAWQQMRENYESIILEDHGFSEQHNMEYALWQLHYRRIEELRAHFNAALASAGSNVSLGAKVPVRPDRISKIRLQFRTFLSEATGFYHDLILKIRSKYGLPLGFFSEGSDNGIVMEKDGTKSSNMKKGLISCHRCLIYLGDLARYKGLYGDGNSKAREHAAASSYYLQAASIWPSSGNPHHQLAILASYSGDELVAAYRYFRSLAVDNPFPTARDNLIVAFEKNRQSYSQLVGGGKVTGFKEDLHMNGRGREKGELNAVSKELNLENGAVKEKASNMHEMLKSFRTRFVRLNGILFTRTSLETFAEVLASTSNEFCELLSSGTEEKFNFGVDAVENGLFILQLVCILMFTVHNVKREAEGQTYAEIVQRAVLLQNAFTSIFEFVGHILGRCVQLQDPSTSYFLPGILVFVEWLASYPDVASGSDMDERQAAVRLKFWNYYISLLNKLLSVFSISFDDNDDETCFSNMTQYIEGETENRLALWEDFELRGFVPLLPAQTILDFSRKQPLGNDGSKEKMTRIKRILAAGKALASIVKLDHKTISFDSKMRKFVIGAESPISDDSMLTIESSTPEAKGFLQELQPEKTINLRMQPKLQPYMGGDDEDEVIVFKPTVAENRNDLPMVSYDEGLKPIQDSSFGDLKFHGGSVPVPLDIIRQQGALDPRPQVSTSVGTMVSQHVQQPIPASKWLGEEVTSLGNSLKSVTFMENGHLMEHEMQKNLPTANSSVQQYPIQNSGNLSTESMFYSPINPLDAVAISGVATELASKMPSSLQSGIRKSPVSRPVRHLGPPPGFNSVPAKQLNESVLGPDLNVNLLMDDYSWLDDCQFSSTKGSGFNNYSSVATHPTSQYTYTLNSNGMTGNRVNFPFPGKLIPPVQSLTASQKGWRNYQALEHLSLQQEQQLQQRLMDEKQLTSIPKQYQGQSIWSSHYMV